MRAQKIIRLKGFVKDIEKILESGKWMTSVQIASQIVWAPEIACREKTKRLRSAGRRVSIFGAHSSLVATMLSDMFKAGKLKRKDVHTSGCKGFSRAKYEYRI